MAIDAKNLLVWVKSMARGQALPLDASEIYTSLEEAEAYAKTSAVAYGGQTIRVLQEDGLYHNYILQPSETGFILQEESNNVNSLIQNDGDCLILKGGNAAQFAQTVEEG